MTRLLGCNRLLCTLYLGAYLNLGALTVRFFRTILWLCLTEMQLQGLQIKEMRGRESHKYHEQVTYRPNTVRARK